MNRIEGSSIVLFKSLLNSDRDDVLHCSRAPGHNQQRGAAVGASLHLRHLPHSAPTRSIHLSRLPCSPHRNRPRRPRQQLPPLHCHPSHTTKKTRLRIYYEKEQTRSNTLLYHPRASIRHLSALQQHPHIPATMAGLKTIIALSFVRIAYALAHSHPSIWLTPLD